jgi:hypothetical protein
VTRDHDVVALGALAALGGIALGAVLDSHHLVDRQRPILDIISGWDWTVISSILVAAGTGMLAIFTWRATMTARSAADVARSAVAESRRSSVLDRTPLLAPKRPEPAMQDGALIFTFEAVNLGPGHALEVGFDVDRQDVDGQPYRPQMAHVIGTSVIAEGDRPFLVVGAEEMRNPDVDWPPGELGDDDTTPPPGLFTPIRVRVRLSWLSPVGTHSRLTYVWDTRDLTGAESQSWAFEELQIDPGPGAGETLVVRGQPTN